MYTLQNISDDDLKTYEKTSQALLKEYNGTHRAIEEKRQKLEAFVTLAFKDDLATIQKRHDEIIANPARFDMLFNLHELINHFDAILKRYELNLEQRKTANVNNEEMEAVIFEHRKLIKKWELEIEALDNDDEIEIAKDNANNFHLLPEDPLKKTLVLPPTTDFSAKVLFESDIAPLPHDHYLELLPLFDLIERKHQLGLEFYKHVSAIVSNEIKIRQTKKGKSFENPLMSRLGVSLDDVCSAQMALFLDRNKVINNLTNFIVTPYDPIHPPVIHRSKITDTQQLIAAEQEHITHLATLMLFVEPSRPHTTEPKVITEAQSIRLRMLIAQYAKENEAKLILLKECLARISAFLQNPPTANRDKVEMLQKLKVEYEKILNNHTTIEELCRHFELAFYNCNIGEQQDQKKRHLLSQMLPARLDELGSNLKQIWDGLNSPNNTMAILDNYVMSLMSHNVDNPLLQVAKELFYINGEKIFKSKELQTFITKRKETSNALKALKGKLEARELAEKAQESSMNPPESPELAEPATPISTRSSFCLLMESSLAAVTDSTKSASSSSDIEVSGRNSIMYNFDLGLIRKPVILKGQKNAATFSFGAKQERQDITTFFAQPKKEPFAPSVTRSQHVDPNRGAAWRQKKNIAGNNSNFVPKDPTENQKSADHNFEPGGSNQGLS